MGKLNRSHKVKREVDGEALIKFSGTQSPSIMRNGAESRGGDVSFLFPPFLINESPFFFPLNCQKGQ